MIGQAFQIEEVDDGSNTYNIKYNTKNGGSKYDETLCVNYPGYIAIQKAGARETITRAR